MRLTSTAAIFILNIITIETVFASEAIALKGTAYLSEEKCAKGLKSPECVLSFEIAGNTAKLLFDGMPAKAVREECTGGMEKADGNGLYCVKSDDGTYACYFGYSFSHKMFTASQIDC